MDAKRIAFGLEFYMSKLVLSSLCVFLVGA